MTPISITLTNTGIEFLIFGTKVTFQYANTVISVGLIILYAISGLIPWLMVQGRLPRMSIVRWGMAALLLVPCGLYFWFTTIAHWQELSRASAKIVPGSALTLAIVLLAHWSVIKDESSTVRQDGVSSTGRPDVR